MLLSILTVAAALAQTYGTPTERIAQAAATSATIPSATPAGRGLKDLPNTAINYYDVQGTSGPAIEKSWKKLLTDPASKDAVELFTWKLGAKISKRTEGEKCTVAAATSTMTSTVNLPRLAEEAKVPKDVLEAWRKNVGAAESDAAASLWFVNDGLRGIDQSIVGLPCDQATPTWNAGLEKLKLGLKEFAAQRAKAVKTAPRQTKGDTIEAPRR